MEDDRAAQATSAVTHSGPTVLPTVEEDEPNAAPQASEGDRSGVAMETADENAFVEQEEDAKTMASDISAEVESARDASSSSTGSPPSGQDDAGKDDTMPSGRTRKAKRK